MTHIFREWLESTDNQKELVSFAGRIRPIILQTLKENISKNTKEIAQELTLSFFKAFFGAAREGDQAKRVWEFPLSSKPIPFKGKDLWVGSCVLAYQLPSPGSNPGVKRGPEPVQEEKDKFVREKEKYFTEFLKNVVLADKTLEELSDTFTHHVYGAISNQTTLEGPKAKVLWRGNITSDGGKWKMGQVVLAHRLPVQEEKALEKAFNSPKDGEPNTPQTSDL